MYYNCLEEKIQVSKKRRVMADQLTELIKLGVGYLSDGADYPYIGNGFVVEGNLVVTTAHSFFPEKNERGQKIDWGKTDLKQHMKDSSPEAKIHFQTTWDVDFSSLSISYVYADIGLDILVLSIDDLKEDVKLAPFHLFDGIPQNLDEIILLGYELNVSQNQNQTLPTLMTTPSTVTQVLTNVKKFSYMRQTVRGLSVSPILLYAGQVLGQEVIGMHAEVLDESPDESDSAEVKTRDKRKSMKKVMESQVLASVVEIATSLLSDSKQST